jgi:hypothetical protein
MTRDCAIKLWIYAAAFALLLVPAASLAVGYLGTLYQLESGRVGEAAARLLAGRAIGARDR